MKLLPGERILYEKTFDGTLKITTHRVRYKRQGGGRETIKSIMLEEVASCAMTRRSQPLLLLYAALCILGGVIGIIQVGWVFVLVLLFGLVMVIAYFLSRKQLVAIASAGTTIFWNTKGRAVANFHELFDNVESAKNGRYLAGHTAAPIASFAKEATTQLAG
jgi:hypothetical protein